MPAGIVLKAAAWRRAALGIAAYVSSHPRPDFVIEEHLPPAEEMGVYNGRR